MNAKKADKLAVGILYGISGIIVLILFSLASLYFMAWSTASFLGVFNKSSQNIY